jgi:PAS domain S-box-containing protein
MGRTARSRAEPHRNGARRQDGAGLERAALARHLELFHLFGNDVLLLFDEERRVVEANQPALAAYGYSREELLGMSARELCAEGPDGDLDRRLLEAGAGIETFECLQRRKDGSTFPAEVSASRLSIAGRRYLQGVVRDIGERRRAEEATAYQAMLLANMNDAVMGLDERFALRAWNRAAERIYGWKAAEVMGQPILRLLKTEYLRGYDSAMLTRLQEDGRIRLEMRQVRKDGTPIEVEGVSVALRDPAGRITGFVAVNRDVTDRRRAEQALRLSEERLKLALEATSDGLWDLNLATGRGYISPQWARLLELPGSELDDARDLVRRHFTPERGTPEARAIRDHYHGRTPWYEYELRAPSSDGEPRFVLLRGKVAERDARGKPVRIIGTVTDITEKKRMQAQLLQSDRMVSMGTLAAGVAHEINNPLAYVVSNLGFVLSELAAAGVDSVHGEGASRTLPGEVLGEMRRALEEAKEGAERVRSIVRDLKTFSRPDETARAEVDVRRVLESAINMARNEIRHRARLVLELGPVPPVRASEHRLGQVFLNLLVNAAQAVPEGRAGENEIRAVTRTDGQGRAVVEVHDTGAGMAPEVLTRIFEPFFTTKPVGVGTGLGLSICHGIVTALGGAMQVESKPGEGSVFKVFLPAAGERDRASPGRPDAARPARSRILVVDDEPLVGRAVQRALSGRHEVVVEQGGRAALARLARGERFDLVLCDLMMPETTGMDLLEELTRLDPAHAGRVAFLTGGAFTAAAREFLERSGRPRIDKPFDPEGLLAAVDALLPREPGA